MKRRIWLTVAFLVLTAGVFIYTYLGGFEEPKIVLKEVEPYTIYGYPYEGRMNVSVFGQAFRKADSLVANKIVKGYTAAYFYNQPTKASENLKAFIGVITTDTGKVNLETRTYTGGKVVEAVLNANYLIIPVNIYPKIQEFGKKKKLRLSEESVEIYENDKKLIIRVPVKD